MELGVSGHRLDKLGGYSDSVRFDLLSFALLQLDIYCPTKVHAGGALGWDQAIMEACVIKHIPFVAHIPFPGFDKPWPDNSRSSLRYLLTKSNYIIYYGQSFSKQVYQLRNIGIVDSSTQMLVLWNGSPGGTANCISYINKVQKPYTNCWEQWVS